MPRRTRPSRRTVLLAALLGTAAGCATLAEGGGGDTALPNAVAGPFREIKDEELGNNRSSPNALESDENLPRDIAVLDEDGDPTTLAVVAFAAATLPPDGQDKASPSAPPNAILRYAAVDGRSWDRAAEPVFVPEEAWEGGTVGAPAVVAVGGELLLFYEASGGIGLALSTDGGHTFQRSGASPVLAPAAGGWEAGAAPRSPGVARGFDGSLRLFYAVETAAASFRIGEARSTDGGRSFARLGSGPALAPATAPVAVTGDAPYDDASVGSPFPLAIVTASGRRILRLYYAARDAAGRTTIALAARDGDDGAFQRAATPVFGDAANDLGPREPCVVRFTEFSFLFATQRAGDSDNEAYPAVAGGVAPGNVTLPAPEPR